MFHLIHQLCDLSFEGKAEKNSFADFNPLKSGLELLFSCQEGFIRQHEQIRDTSDSVDADIRCDVWVRVLVSYIKWQTEAEGVWEQMAVEGTGSNRELGLGESFEICVFHKNH
jgi:hypothetical protein